MSEKKLKITFNILIALLLLLSLVRLALAAPQLQDGEQSDSQNQGNNPSAGQNNTVSICAQTYTVQRGDSLSTIAQRFLGNLLAYDLIFQATNAAVGTDGFTPIRDPNLIEPGQILCIPASNGVISGTTGTVLTSTTQITPTDATIAGLTFTLAANEGVLLVENRAGGDFVFDLTQPKPGSALVPPNYLQPFIVPAGLQGYMAHHPIGQFSITPGQVQVAAGQITHLICFREVCQLAALVQPSDSQAQAGPKPINQPVIAGQQPPHVDNDNNENDNHGNGNGNNNNHNGNDNNSNGNDNNGNNNNNGNDNNGNNNNNGNDNNNNNGNGNDNNGNDNNNNNNNRNGND